ANADQPEHAPLPVLDGKDAEGLAALQDALSHAVEDRFQLARGERLARPKDAWAHAPLRRHTRGAGQQIDSSHTLSAAPSSATRPWRQHIACRGITAPATPASWHSSTTNENSSALRKCVSIPGRSLLRRTLGETVLFWRRPIAYARASTLPG